MTVYACAPFFNERDQLEIKLREQASAVDVVVLAEAEWTYAGTPKPIRLAIDGEWRPWLDDLSDEVGVEVRVVDVRGDPPPGDVYQAHVYPMTVDRWARENFQRRSLMRGLGDMRDDDVVMVSDLDEIVRASVIQWYADTDQELMVVPMLPMHVAMIDLRWDEALAVIARLARGSWARELDTEGLRRTPGQPLPIGNPAGDALSRYGWHLSYLGGRDAIQYKIDNAAHPEMAPMANIDAALTGTGDLFNRHRRRVYRCPPAGLPPCVAANPERWRRHLLYYPPADEWPDVMPTLGGLDV